MPTRVIPEGPVRGQLGRKLRDAREALGWSLAGAAEEVGVLRTTLGSWERGDRVPSPDALWACARAYGRRIEEFFPPQDDAEAQGPNLYVALDRIRKLVDAAVGQPAPGRAPEAERVGAGS